MSILLIYSRPNFKKIYDLFPLARECREEHSSLSYCFTAITVVRFTHFNKNLYSFVLRDCSRICVLLFWLFVVVIFCSLKIDINNLLYF